MSGTVELSSTTSAGVEDDGLHVMVKVKKGFFTFSEPLTSEQAFELSDLLSLAANRVAERRTKQGLKP